MDYFMGMIGVFGFYWAPEYFSTCQGQILTVNQYQALYTLLGGTYGGSPPTTFGLPNLQGRTVIGQGILAEPSGTHQYQMGQFSGATQTALSTAQMPAHIHTATISGGGAGTAANVHVSTSPGTKTTPAPGDYLGAVNNANPDPVSLYVDQASPGTTVALGGVTGGGGSGGTITINPAGNSGAFSLMQPYMVMNPCICVQGLYPIRPS
ncbi:MAG: hypothetical protein VR70_18735 [Rhodospirillaceae bacterium BRH_c57]|nr:MAG: hypothetical protein VR70_18735 [Rhodospirillaceae bacterium BRH_c57]